MRAAGHREPDRLGKVRHGLQRHRVGFHRNACRRRPATQIIEGVQRILSGDRQVIHLTAGTLNQAALARGRAPLAALAWLASGALFVVFMLSEAISNQVTLVEVSYFTAALVLCGLLWAIYRRGPAAAGAPRPAGASAGAG